MKNFLLFYMAISFLCTSHLFALPFTEDFEGNLSQWTGINNGSHHGTILVDPLNPGGVDDVLSFTANVVPVVLSKIR